MPQLSDEAIQPTFQGDDRVLCIAGQTPIDEAAALMLAQMLGKHGLAARALGPEATSSAMIAGLVESAPALICLCYLNAGGAAHMRYAVKRLRRRLPSACIVLASLATEAGANGGMTDVPADDIASTLRDVSKACLSRAMQPLPLSTDLMEA